MKSHNISDPVILPAECRIPNTRIRFGEEYGKENLKILNQITPPVGYLEGGCLQVLRTEGRIYNIFHA
jgi:hypothetical protein